MKVSGNSVDVRFESIVKYGGEDGVSSVIFIRGRTLVGLAMAPGARVGE